MAKQYPGLTEKHVEFIADQQMFFVASAPTASDGHVNVSPKGMDSFRVLSPNTVAYLDVTGSGVETISHVKDNGRLVIMFCAFSGSPLTLRLHGQAEVLETGQPRFAELIDRFPDLPGRRAIIQLNVSRVADSCGWTVPLYEHVGYRDYYDRYAEAKGAEGMREAQLAVNMHSIDGLKALDKPSF